MILCILCGFTSATALHWVKVAQSQISGFSFPQKALTINASRRGEMADARDLKSLIREGCAGSSPAAGTAPKMTFRLPKALVT